MAASQLNRVIEHLRRVLVQQDAARTPDDELLKRYLQQRDEAAFEALVRKHGPMVLGVCRRVLRNLHDAEDAFQATFLVLVRKASTLRCPATLGNWLYGVAYRTALHAHAAAAKRRAKEAQVIARTEPATDARPDLRFVLDLELERLPRKYRVVVILCDLEERTRKEAAHELGWAEGTVASRLARGRALLAKRLARHGLVLSAGSLASLLSEQALSAGVPTALVVSTVKAAILFAAGQAATAGVISVEVAALTKGVLTVMFLSKLKVTMAVVLMAAAVVAGTGVCLSQVSGGDTPEAKALASERDRQENKAAGPAQTSNEADRVITNPDEIANAYLTNSALADEKFVGKRVAVTGTMARITRQQQSGVVFQSGGPAAPHPTELGRIYQLEMRLKGVDAPGKRPAPILKFQFSSEERKHLARLKEGQRVTVEGVPGEPAPEGNVGFILFKDCKIIKSATETKE